MDLDINERLAVRVLYPCHICGQSYVKGPYTIDHLHQIHAITIPKRPTGKNRPPNKQYIYIGIHGDKWDEIHHGCSSCWFHTSNMEELRDHVNNEHVNKKSATEKESTSGKKPEYEEGSTSGKKPEHAEGSTSKRKPGYDKQVARNLVQQVLDLADILARVLKV